MYSDAVIRISPWVFTNMTEAGPFDVAVAADGTAWVSNTGGLPFGEYPRSVARYALVNGALQQQFLRFFETALGACPSILTETHGSLSQRNNSDLCISA